MQLTPLDRLENYRAIVLTKCKSIKAKSKAFVKECEETEDKLSDQKIGTNVGRVVSTAASIVSLGLLATPAAPLCPIVLIFGSASGVVVSGIDIAVGVVRIKSLIKEAKEIEKEIIKLHEKMEKLHRSIEEEIFKSSIREEERILSTYIMYFYLLMDDHSSASSMNLIKEIVDRLPAEERTIQGFFQEIKQYSHMVEYYPIIKEIEYQFNTLTPGGHKLPFEDITQEQIHKIVSMSGARDFLKLLEIGITQVMTKLGTELLGVAAATQGSKAVGILAGKFAAKSALGFGVKAIGPIFSIIDLLINSIGDTEFIKISKILKKWVNSINSLNSIKLIKKKKD